MDGLEFMGCLEIRSVAKCEASQQRDPLQQDGDLRATERVSTCRQILDNGGSGMKCSLGTKSDSSVNDGNDSSRW